MWKRWGGLCRGLCSWPLTCEDFFYSKSSGQMLDWATTHTNTHTAALSFGPCVLSLHRTVNCSKTQMWLLSRKRWAIAAWGGRFQICLSCSFWYRSRKWFAWDILCHFCASYITRAFVWLVCSMGGTGMFQPGHYASSICHYYVQRS